MLSKEGVKSLTSYICQDIYRSRWENEKRKPSGLEQTKDQGDKGARCRKQAAGAGLGSVILEGHSLESPKMTTNLLCSSCWTSEAWKWTMVLRSRRRGSLFSRQKTMPPQERRAAGSGH